jgi:DNA-binding protein HU-beta
MTKTEFVKALKEKAGLATIKQAEDAFESTLGLISQTLKKDGELTFTGFGSFKVVKRAARQGRNPRTGNPIQIPAQKTIKFTVGKTLKEEVC